MTSPLAVDRPSAGVLRLRLQRAERRNALDAELVAALAGALEAAAEPAVVLCADGTAFSAGADLDLADAERALLSDRLYALYEQMARHPAVILAALDGPAVGGGAQLALASDLRVLSPRARIKLAGPGHGLAVGAWALPGLAGRGRALDLCLTMRSVDAEEAQRLGLADRVAPDAEAAALELAAHVAGLDSGATARVKAVARTATGDLEALRREREENRASWGGAVPGRGGAVATPVAASAEGSPGA